MINALHTVRSLPFRAARQAKATLSITFVVLSMWGSVANAEPVIIHLNAVGSDTAGNVLLQFPPGSFNPCGCLVFSETSPGGKQMLSLATAALMAGKPVYVNRVGGAAPANGWGIGDTTTEVRIVKTQ